MALIDADFYIINYRSCITTYIQSIHNNLRRGRRDALQNGDNNENIEKAKKIICIFMLQIFLNNIDKNVNLFDVLHEVINKYHYLIKRDVKSQCNKCQGNAGNENRNSNQLLLNNNGGEIDQEENIIAFENKNEWLVSASRNIRIGTSQQVDMNKYEERKKNGQSGESGENDKNGQRSQNGENPINQLIHNLIQNGNYVNSENIASSKICVLNISNKEKDVKSSSESFGDNFCEEENSEGTELCTNLKSEKVKYCKKDKYTNDSNNNEEESRCSTYKLNNFPPSRLCKKRFIINYNNISLKIKTFDNVLNMTQFIEEEIVKKHKINEEYLREIKNLYRIIILSKLHIGVYKFLSLLKKKNFFFIFYTSNKKLTHLLFKYFKIRKSFKNQYTLINSFDDLKNFKNYKKCLVFSNRQCFVNYAKRYGYFRIAKGKKNSSISSNCDDINWEDIIIAHNKCSKVSKDSIDSKGSTDSMDSKCSKDAISSNSSDYNSNKYNDVVYPFERNCNLTKDILSWRTFYIFNKYIYIYGKVVKGFGRGSKYLNIPTANIFNSNLTSADIMPGIYFGLSKLKKKIYKTVISIGYNPYFENKHITVEAFLYYQTSNLFYNENIHLIIFGILRSESNFPSFSHLIQAIQFDCELARIILNKIKNDDKFVMCKSYLNSL
ncbi:riboflavin kinase / FAD synthase family protein, putative [Plasmodium malariae]|nr:riboflavin kinase / FAD synthase family protein, putative [Plasmodium malariae]